MALIEADVVEDDDASEERSDFRGIDEESSCDHLHDLVLLVVEFSVFVRTRNINEY